MTKIFELLLEIIGWLQIAISPFLISLGIAAYIYFSNPNQSNLIIAISIGILGLTIGVVWATKIWITKGTFWFVSQISATPDLDNYNEESNNETEK